jgi:hypothetical protein
VEILQGQSGPLPTRERGGLSFDVVAAGQHTIGYGEAFIVTPLADM